MTTTFTERRAAGEHILSEEDFNHCRDHVTLAQSASFYEAGSVLALTADKYHLAAAADTAVAVLLAGVDASAADTRAVAHVRGPAQMKRDCLSYAADVDQPAERAAKEAQLAAIGIIVR